MKRVLVISGHTDLNNSVANKEILNELESRLSNIEISYLDRLYPDYKIEVNKEQEKLERADIIVLQYPIFWYGMPSILKKWIEDVLVRGFSHGSNGDKLKGKRLIVSITTGAQEEAYHKDGSIGYEIDEFLPAIKATCKLCGMDYAGYVYTGGVSYQLRNNEDSLKLIKEKSDNHTTKLIDLINNL